jgi:hypothetical protein
VARFPTFRLLLALEGLLLIGSSQAQAPRAKPASEGIVFIVDGSARLRSFGEDLHQAVNDAQLALEVESFDWSHGMGRVLSDLHGHDHQRAKGKELAERIIVQRHGYAGGKIYLVCHSSGAAVVLAAVAQLPADSVQRIVMLAPALSPSCDLRPALRCARRGVDAFYSQNDVIGRMALPFVGTADGQFLMSAGCVGFTLPQGCNRDDALLYLKFRQHPWIWEMSKIGYYGGHFGCTRGSFLRTYVVPLLAID